MSARGSRGFEERQRIPYPDERVPMEARQAFVLIHVLNHPEVGATIRTWQEDWPQLSGDVQRTKAEEGSGVARNALPAVVGKILAHLALLHPVDSPGPAPPSAALRAAAPSQQSSVPVSGLDSAPAGRVLTAPRSPAQDRSWWLARLGITDALRAVLSAPASPLSVPTGPGPGW